MTKEATKDDKAKPAMALIPVRAEMEIAKGFTYGAYLKPRPDGTKGYGLGNWHDGAGFDHSRLLSALKRHISYYQLGEDMDTDSICPEYPEGIPHLALAGCCLMMLLEHSLSGLGNDDRAKAQHLITTKPPIVRMPLATGLKRSSTVPVSVVGEPTNTNPLNSESKS